MSWRAALAAMTTGGGPSTAASRKALFDVVARAHLFGPPGFQWSAEGLRVVREVRWHLLATGSTAVKSNVMGHIMRVYGAAAHDMSRHTTLSTRNPRHRGHAHAHGECGLTPSLEAVLAEQVQCLAEAKVHGVKLQPWHVKGLLQSPLLAAVGPELALLVLQEVAETGPPHKSTHASSSSTSPSLPVEAVMDCAAGLASAGYAAAAWELLAPYQLDAKVAADFPALIEVILRSQSDGHARAVALVQQIPIAFLLEADSRGWVDGAVRAYERQARHGAEVTDSVVTWVTALLSPSSSSPLSSSVVAGAVLEAALRLLPLASPTSPSSLSWQLLMKSVLDHNTVCQASAASEDAMIPVARLGRFLRRIGQPEAYLTLLFGGSPDAWRDISDSPGSDDGPALVHDVWDMTAVSAHDKRDVAVYNELLLALAACGKPMVALAYYEQWLRACGGDTATTMNGAGAAGTLEWPRPSAATHWCVLQLVLRPETLHVHRQSDAPAQTAPLTEAVYRTCERALTALVAEDSHEDTRKREWDLTPEHALPPADSKGNDTDAEAREKTDPTVSTSRALATDTEGLTESFVLWAAARDGAEVWEDAVLWGLRAPTEHCRYAQLIALAAAARARARLHLARHPRHTRPVETTAAAASSATLESVEAAVVKLVVRLCHAPHCTRKQLCLLVASLSTTLASTASSTSAAVWDRFDDRAVEGDTGSLLVCQQGEHSNVELEPGVLAPIVSALSAHIGDSQAVMDQVIQQTIEYYISLRRRCAAAAQGGARGADHDVAWLGARVRSRTQLLDSTLQLMGEAAAVAVAVATPSHHGQPEEAAEVEVEDWHVIAQVLRAVSQRTGVSMAQAAPALVSAGLKADVAIHFLA